MSNSCVWHPCRVDRQTGKLTNRLSKLYKSLLKLKDMISNYDRARVNKLFALSQDSRFIAKYDENMVFDSDEADKEPVLTSFYEIAKSQMPEVRLGNIRDIVAEEFGEGEYDYDGAYERMQTFNQTMQGSHSLMATIERQTNGKYLFKIDYNTQENQDKLVKTLTQKLHAEAIIDRLKQFGVGVDINKDDLSRFNTLDPKILSDGLMGIISLGENHQTLQDLAMETGHFIAEALGPEHPFIKKIINAVQDERVVRNLLGDTQYEIYQDSDNKIEEFVGHLIGQYLSEYDINLSKKPLKHLGQLIQRAVAYIKSRMHLTNRSYHKSLYDAKYNAIKAVKSFMGDNFKGTIEQALSEQKTLYYVDNSVEGVARQLLRKLVITEKKLEGTSQSASKNLRDFRKMEFEMYEKAKSFNEMGVLGRSEKIKQLCNMLVSSIDYTIGQFNEASKMLTVLINATNTSGLVEINEYARVLKFCQQVMNLIDFISTTYNTNAFKDQLPAGEWRNNFQKVLDEFKVIIATEIKKGGSDKGVDFKEAIRQARFNLAFRLFCEMNGSKFMSMDQFVSYKKRFDKKLHFPRLQRNKEKLLRIDALLDEKDRMVYAGTYWIDRFINSMADNSSEINQLVYNLIEEKKQEANVRTLQMKERILDLYRRIPKSGIVIRRDTRRFMETFDDGSLTGNLLSNVHWGKWEKNLKEHLKNERQRIFKEYREKYHWATKEEMIKSASFLKMYNKIKMDWHNDNSVWTEDESTGLRIYRPNSSYINQDYYDKLSQEERDWLDEYKELKMELDNLLPPMSTAPDGIRVPQFLSTFTEAVNTSVRQDGIKNKSKGVGAIIWQRAISHNFYMSPEDTEWGGENNTYDFDEMEEAYEYGLFQDDSYVSEVADIDKLPMYGVKLLPDLKQLSTDICGSLIAYANMAYNFDSLDKVAGAVEELAQYRKTINYTEDKNKFANSIPLGYERLESYIQQQVFGKFFKNVKPWNRSLRKTAGTITSLASIWHLGWNYASSFVNTMTALYQMLRASIKGEDFSFPDFIFANAYFFKYAIPAIFGSIFNPNGSLFESNNVMELLARRWDTTNSNFRKFRDMHLNTPGYDWLAGFSITNIAMLPYSLPEKWMQSVAYFATARHTKARIRTVDEAGNLTYKYSNLLKIYGEKDGKLYIKDADGKLMTDKTVEDGLKVWQIYDIDQERKIRIAKRIKDEGPIQKDVNGPGPEFGWTEDDIAELRKYTGVDYIDYEAKEDNTYDEAWVDFDEKRENLFRIKCRGIDNRMHGVYNTSDGGTYLGYLWGPMFASMKKYAIGMIDERFAKERYDYRKKEMREGNAQTVFKIFLDVTIESAMENSFSKIKRQIEEETGDSANKAEVVTKSIWRTIARGIKLATAFTVMAAPYHGSWAEKYLRSWGYSELQIRNIYAFWADYYLVTMNSILISFFAPPLDDEDAESYPDFLNFIPSEPVKRFLGAVCGHLPFVNRHDWGARKGYFDIEEARDDRPALQKWISDEYFAMRRWLPFEKTEKDEEYLSNDYQEELTFKKHGVLPFDLQSILYFTTFRNRLENVAFNPFVLVPSAGFTPVFLIQECQQLMEGGLMPIIASFEMWSTLSTIYDYFTDPNFKENEGNIIKRGRYEGYYKISRLTMRHDFGRVGESYKDAYETKEEQEHFLMETLRRIFKGRELKEDEIFQ